MPSHVPDLNAHMCTQVCVRVCMCAETETYASAHTCECEHEWENQKANGRGCTPVSGCAV